ncbi:MAG: hypothetical protein IPP96_15950 [Chitinophagaceae bacterium]|nr:hypothetical protein [Chitinophagaceae bacterium]
MFDLNVGIGNGIFSLKNNSLNAGQSSTNKLFYTGSAGYYHLKRAGTCVTGFMANDEGIENVPICSSALPISEVKVLKQEYHTPVSWKAHHQF